MDTLVGGPGLRRGRRHPERVEFGAGAGACTELTMAARFRPKGVLGILYWYSVLPLHNIVFGGMLRGIRRAAEVQPR
jgi:hypothetical protein